MPSANPNFYYPTECWNVTTLPIHPLACFVRDELDDEAIQQLLKETCIKTMHDLSNNIECIRPMLREGTEDDLRQVVQVALQHTSPEESLGGKIIVYPFCISPTSLSGYSAQAVSVEPSTIVGPIPDFTLVMGPKRSGKTLFAVKRLPQLVFPQATSADILCLHYNPSSFAEKMRGRETFAFAVAKSIEDSLAHEISGFGTVPPLQLYLHVVIDQAMEEPRHFDRTDKFHAIVHALKTMDRYSFRGVHLTVVGSELESVVKRVDSRDTIIFRMQPWKRANHPADEATRKRLRRELNNKEPTNDENEKENVSKKRKSYTTRAVGKL